LTETDRDVGEAVAAAVAVVHEVEEERENGNML